MPWSRWGGGGGGGREEGEMWLGVALLVLCWRCLAMEQVSGEAERRWGGGETGWGGPGEAAGKWQALQ